MIAERSGATPSRGRAPSTPMDPVLVAVLDVAAVVVTAGLMAMAAVGATGGLRLALALAFVTFVPGWAVLDHVKLVDGANARLALAVALSLTISTFAALAGLWLHVWHPIALLDAIGAASLLAVLAHLRRYDPGARAGVRSSSAGAG